MKSPIRLRKFTTKVSSKLQSVDSIFLILSLVFFLTISAPEIVIYANLKLDDDLLVFFSNPWRLFSAHWVHVNWQHWAINMTNLLALRLLIKPWFNTAEIYCFLVFVSLFISVGLFYWNSFEYYSGFSGVLYALIIYISLKNQKLSPVFYRAIIGCLLGKLIYDIVVYQDDRLNTSLGFYIAKESHFLGVFAGIIFYLRYCYIMRR